MSESPEEDVRFSPPSLLEQEEEMLLEPSTVGERERGGGGGEEFGMYTTDVEDDKREREF